ncbi:proepiregulin-like isoform X1 [Betta splendens]|uniref:Proepiregulin-like isoform X1 n=1 Tax=Betta splendens TaxID=158456 RepID=A0A6P7NNU9_BETSP|nr:proepiregulin-like isoform X1 [Betta splendens]
MWNRGGTRTLLSLIGLMLLWPSVLTKSIASTLNHVASVSLSPGQREERPHVAKRSTQSCDSSFDGYCLNNGQCMLLVDINEHHCNCDLGFYGHRCAEVDFVSRPMGETQIIFITFCVILLILGLAGVLYFFWKWYKNRLMSQQKAAGSRAAQTV